MLGVKSGSARMRGGSCSGAKIAAGTNESISQRPCRRLKTAVNEIERRLEQNRREQKLISTVAKRHRDPGVDRLCDLLAQKK